MIEYLGTEGGASSSMEMTDKKGAEDRQVAGDDSDDDDQHDSRGVDAYGTNRDRDGYSKVATDSGENKHFVIDIGGKKDSAVASMLEVNGTGMVKRAEGGSS
jgi:hypothetical protein